jgi:hypothetical protein
MLSRAASTLAEVSFLSRSLAWLVVIICVVSR